MTLKTNHKRSNPQQGLSNNTAMFLKPTTQWPFPIPGQIKDPSNKDLEKDKASIINSLPSALL